jgi:predicted helicase
LTNAVIQIQTGKKYKYDRTLTFVPRPEQQKCINEASDYFRLNKTKKEKFLINAKMRFGKCFVTYKICQTLGFKNILILT